MNKENLLSQIVTRLEADYKALLQAVETTKAEVIDDDDDCENPGDSSESDAASAAQKKEAQAQELQRALETFRELNMQNYDEQTPICLTALVSLVDVRGRSRQVFLGPAAGGLRFKADGGEVMIVTPASSLGRQLVGKQCGDLIELDGATLIEYEIVSVC